MWLYEDDCSGLEWSNGGRVCVCVYVDNVMDSNGRMVVVWVCMCVKMIVN